MKTTKILVQKPEIGLSEDNKAKLQSLEIYKDKKHFQFSNGWVNLAYELGKNIEEVCKLVNCELPKIEAIYNKYNSLRVDYHFVSNAKFDEMISTNAFLEWASFAGARYGTPRLAVEEALSKGLNVILEIELDGARQVRKNSKDALLVFIEPPSWEELTTRLIKRGTESEQSTQARLIRAKEELSAAAEFDHVLINHQVDQSVSELVSLALR